MNKFAIALAAVVSLGLAIPAFAEDMPAGKMQSDKMHGGKTGMQHTMVVHHHHYHHHYHHMVPPPAPKPQ